MVGGKRTPWSNNRNCIWSAWLTGRARSGAGEAVNLGDSIATTRSSHSPTGAPSSSLKITTNQNSDGISEWHHRKLSGEFVEYKSKVGMVDHDLEVRPDLISLHRIDRRQVTPPTSSSSIYRQNPRTAGLVTVMFVVRRLWALAAGGEVCDLGGSEAGWKQLKIAWDRWLRNHNYRHY